MKRGKILATPRSLSRNGHPLLSRLETAGFEVLRPFPGIQPTEDALRAVLPDCVGHLAGVEHIGAELIRSCTKLKVISRYGVGIDNIDIEAAKEAGIQIRITRGTNSRAVAELTMGLMLSLLRRIPQVNQAVKNGGWERREGLEASGRTLGIVGMGQVGQHVAAMGAGLNMNSLGYDPYPNPDGVFQIRGFQYAGLDEVIEKADVLTLHCPAGKQPLIDANCLRNMRHGSFLINTARSALVDKRALLSALQSGAIAGYAVDVFEAEPPELTPLFQHPHVLMTAHIGAYTSESIGKTTSASVDNLLEVLQ